jgi:hypothetical protein
MKTGLLNFIVITVMAACFGMWQGSVWAGVWMFLVPTTALIVKNWKG